MTNMKTMRWWALVAVAGLMLGGSLACTTDSKSYPTQAPARDVGDTEIGDGGLVADFDFEIDQDTLTVIFTDQSVGVITSWSWDFGDGKKSQQQDPVHQYKQPGSYVVTLTVSNPDTQDSASAFVVFETEEPAPPTAAFAFAIDVVDPLKVVFSDQSTGDVTSWSWDFGDGTSSGAQNPVKTYGTAGTFLVVLTVSGPAGSDSASAFVLVGEEPPEGD